MKAVKVIGFIFFLLVVAVAVTLYYAYRNVDTLLHDAVENYGSDVTETQVALEAVDVDFQAGRIQLSELVIANPPDYTTDYAFALDGIAVQIDTESLGAQMESLVVLDEITVDGARIIAELKNLRESNLQQLAENIQNNLPEPGEPVEANPEGSSEYVGPNFRVREFAFTNAQITVVSEQFGDRTIDMPAVQATDIGGELGVPPRELGAALMKQVLDQAVVAVREEVEDAAKQKVRSRVEEEVQEKLNPQEQEQLQNLRDFLNR
ncbi:hypothetical protein F6455_11420 [Proteobacteria bacterium 005FR1]|nr:hypothetical protein [Proteobacteria bacterium 005FR1]